MKKLVAILARASFLAAVVIVGGCSAGKPYVDSFEHFVQGVTAADNRIIERYSTESTQAIVRQMLRNQSLRENNFIIDNIVNASSATSGMHRDIVIVRDSVSHSGTEAWVWFRIDGREREMVVKLVERNNKWLVDIPLLGR